MADAHNDPPPQYEPAALHVSGSIGCDSEWLSPLF